MISKETAAAGLLCGLIGFGLGVFGMYLFDPERGTRRRAELRNKAESVYLKSQKALGRMEDEIGQRAAEAARELKAAVARA